jgi:diguanylate cyclase (GGDEF)-like protein
MNAPSSDSRITLRTLIIEDNEDDALLLVNELKRSRYDVIARRVFTKTDLQIALKDSWDIVFCDHSMPAMNGVEALSIMRQFNEDVPFIFVSGTIGEDVAADAMRKGAQDYIMKDNLMRLAPAVERELSDYQVRKERREAERRLIYLARFDGLTALPNRHHFIEQLELAIKTARSEASGIAVVFIDIDRFKNINNSLGYEAGNILLKEVARRLQVCVEKGVISRLATDEFALLLPFQARAHVDETLQQISKSLEDPYAIYGLSLFFTASIGVSVFPEDARDAENLLRNADIATYRVKDDGGRGVLYYMPSMAVKLEERLALEWNMRTGLPNNEFYLLYQPQVDLWSGKIVGVEALLRWQNSELGSISPAQFIPLAEETGFILPLGSWVLREACKQLKLWQRSLPCPIRMAVNVAARQFHDVDLVEYLGELVQNHDVDTKMLELEITETTIIRDVEKAISTLQAIQRMGIAVALDDFGTGYSSLSYLKAFRTDYLKIDQSFVRGIPHDFESQAIVGAVIAMAKKLSIKTIAEGVETKEQYEFLKSQGCDVAQGFYISKAISSDQISDMVLKSPVGGYG